MSENEHKADAAFRAILSGKKIVEVRRLTNQEMENTGWYSNPLVLILDDGSLLFPQSDDEGNNGGALVHYADKETIMFTV